MSSKVKLLGPFHWRERHLHPCQGDCESATWYYRKHRKFPKCKHSGLFEYKQKQYCMLHMGLVLIKENLE